MPEEIERKFLIDRDKLVLPDRGVEIQQGYLPLAEASKTVVRVRIKGDKGLITVKGENVGAARPEYEYEIPIEDAREMLSTLCQRPIIEKTRYEILVGGHLWEVDLFRGDNDGLMIAEVELSHVDETFERPGWVTSEVTDDARYYNANLLSAPYSQWQR